MLHASTANAQATALDPGWSGSEILVVPSLPDDRDAAWLEGAVRQLAPLGSSVENVHARFEEQHSTTPAEVSHDDVDRWLTQSRNAVRHLALTDYAAARDALLQAQALSERAAEALNREAELQRHVLDTCLYMVRAFLETHAQANAETQARECRRLVPRGEPSPVRHTPEVRELLRRVDRQLAEEQPGSLFIEADRPGCVVRLNGIDFGRTPFEMHDLARGEYRVQVECDTEIRGRVHRLRLEREGTRVRVDTHFDASIRTEPVVHLRYATSDAENASRLSDAVTIARAVSAREVWILTPAFASPEDTSPASFRLDRVLVGDEPEVVASVLLPGPNDAARPFHEPVVQSAQRALADERSADLRADTPIEIATWSPRSGIEARVEANEEPTGKTPFGSARLRRRLGIALSSGGVALLAASAGLYAHRKRVGDDVGYGNEPGFLDAQRRWVSTRAPMLAAGILGSSATSAGLGLVLRDVERRRAVPTWAWILGGLGIGATAAGVVDLARADVCPRDVRATAVCVPGSEQRDRGSLLLLAGVPLASLPFGAWLGHRRAPSVSVSTSSTQASIHVEGVF